MTFDEVLAQVLALLQRERRLAYRALKLRFDIDDDYIEGIKDELIYAKKLAVDEENRVLVWTGNVEGVTETPSPPPQSIPSTLIHPLCRSSLSSRDLPYTRCGTTAAHGHVL